MELQTNIVFEHMQDCKNPIIVEQGGTRSGKTYNILIWLIFKAKTEWNGIIIDITRKSFPSLRASVMFDFFQILTNCGWYNQKNHNKTENIYKIGTNIFRFFSCDDPQKMRGPGRDYLFMNEVNEFSLEDFTQLNMRTRVRTIMDYNPSDEHHWIYDKVLTRKDVDFYITTYLNNYEFLPKRMIQEIENFKKTDENYWNIYGLGKKGISKTTIYTNWELTSMDEPVGEIFYGLDFGFNDPNALVKIVIFEGGIWVKELVYKSQMTTPDLINYMKDASISSTASIYGDNSRPETIQEIYMSGFNIYPCKKGAGSVKAGIDHIKRRRVYITKDSINLLKEIKSYKWKVDKDGRVLDEPVGVNDHLMDALRYSMNEKLRPGDEFGDVLEFNF